MLVEVVDPQQVILYYAVCPICQKYYISTSKYQLYINILQHMKKHKKKRTSAKNIQLHYIVLDILGRQVK